MWNRQNQYYGLSLHRSSSFQFNPTDGVTVTRAPLLTQTVIIYFSASKPVFSSSIRFDENIKIPGLSWTITHRNSSFCYYKHARYVEEHPPKKATRALKDFESQRRHPVGGACFQSTATTARLRPFFRSHSFSPPPASPSLSLSRSLKDTHVHLHSQTQTAKDRHTQ